MLKSNHNRNYKIAMVVWNDLKTDARVRREAKALSDAGYDVEVFSIHRDAFLDSIKDKEYKVKSYFSPVANNRIIDIIRRIRISMKILKSIMDSDCDVVHIHDVNMAHIGIALSVFKNKKIVYDAHEISTEREGYRNFKILVYTLEKIILKRCSLFITTTGMRAKHFKDKYGYSDTIVIQNRCDNPSFNGVCLKEWDVLYQGGLQPGRGIRNLIRLAKELPEVKFLIVGGGIQSNLVEDASRKLSNLDYIKTVRYENLVEITKRCSIGIQILRNTCFNHYTTDSNKVFEYINSGLPVIASDFPEIREIVHKNRVGLLVNPVDINEIKKNILDLKMNDTLFKHLRDNVIAVQKKLHWNIEKKKLVNAYKNMVFK